MNVRIYQINMKRDANNVAFMNYESLPKFQGSSEIDSSLYDKVFEGEVNCFTLEKLYEIFNLKHPAGYKGRSMSVILLAGTALPYNHLHQVPILSACPHLLHGQLKRELGLR